MFTFLRQLSNMQLAIALSLVLHAFLLTLKFAAPQAFNRMFGDIPLEVILVNAKSNTKADQAQALAQHSLAGGGESSDPKMRATSPLPSAVLDSIGNSLEENQRRIAAMEEEQSRLLTQAREHAQRMQAIDPNQQNLTPEEKTAQEEKRRQFIKQLAEIERRVNEQNSRPKKRYISPATQEVVFALYYDRLRRLVETKGTAMFPEQNGKKLYGQLIMTLEVDVMGRLLNVTVDHSSGNKALDNRAMAIARASAPFGAFTEDMKKQAGILVIPTLISFTHDNTLEASFQASEPKQ